MEMFPDRSGDNLVSLSQGMDTVRSGVFLFRRDAFQQEGDQRSIIFFGQQRIDRVEFFRIFLAVVGRREVVRRGIISSLAVFIQKFLGLFF